MAGQTAIGENECYAKCVGCFEERFSSVMRIYKAF